MLWVSGIFFLLMRKIARKFNKDWSKLLGYAFLALAIFAMAFAPLPFVSGSVATWGAALVGWLLGLVGGLIGVSVAVLAGVALVTLLVFTVVDLKDKKPDGIAKTTVFCLPVLALLASGPLAANVVELMNTIGGVGPSVVASIT